MRKDDFRNWLYLRLHGKPVSDCLSRCSVVERSLSVDLDDEYLKDNGASLMEKLRYSIDDEHKERKAPEGFHFKVDANIRQRMTDLRSAVKRYFAFCAECKPGGTA